ncbi:MAG: flagellar hook protein FlgE [Halomonas sp.]|uniref:flagellar hook protein FlgE n=1 Tax=Halomonas sp. TaxID=1486246 RepID=UPI003970474A
MSFSQALSGLNAQQQKLGAIGNNIANSQTVGFKSSDVQFADVFANSRIGLGTKVSSVLQNFGTGNIESTSRNLDLAIGGDGFFRFQQPTGEVAYSRNGQLTFTAEGELINSQGARIMGYPADNNGLVQAGGAPAALNVPTGDLLAQATTNLSIEMNLDAGEEAPASGAFDHENPDTYNYVTNATVYDSLGNSHSVSLYFIKTLDGAPADNNEWSVEARLGDEQRSAGTLSFDNSGRQAAGTETPVTFALAGFNEGGTPENVNLTFDIDLTRATQFGNDSIVTSATQDGYTSGALVGITIEDDGTIMRNYANEQSLAAGQIALANFRNPEGLRPVGDNLWTATQASGQEVVGAPGTGQLGQVVSSAVESSNVDMARELVDMIIAQRAYQANSQTISTQDELLQTIINL